jgi:hypothetical protein
MRYADKNEVTKQVLTKDGTLQCDGCNYAVSQTRNYPK